MVTVYVKMSVQFLTVVHSLALSLSLYVILEFYVCLFVFLFLVLCRLVNNSQTNQKRVQYSHIFGFNNFRSVLFNQIDITSLKGIFCNNAVQQCCATMLCNNAVQQCCATMVCNNAVQQWCATMLCNNGVLSTLGGWVLVSRVSGIHLTNS